MMRNTLQQPARSCLRLSLLAATVAAILMPASSLAAVPLDADGKYSLFGDVRLRAEADQAETQAGETKSRNRLRYRVRVGVSFKPNEHWSGKLRLATTSSQNSPYVNFASEGQTAETSFGIDTAYLAYAGVRNLSLQGGRMPLRFWQQNEVFWDDDIHPDALAAVVNAGPVTLNGSYVVLTAGNWDNKPAADRSKSAFIYQAVWQGGGALKTTAALGGASVNDPEDVYNATQHTQLSGQVKGGAWLAGADYLRSNAEAENIAYVLQGRYKPTRSVGLRAYYYHVEAFSTLGDGTYTQDNFPSNRDAADNFRGVRLQVDYQIAKAAYVDFRYYDSQIISRNLVRIGGTRQHAKNTRAQVNLTLKF